ncbi:hypothetical protein [Spirosoma aerophilum]
MRNLNCRRGLILLALAGSLSCTKNTFNPPEPAVTLAGRYEARLTVPASQGQFDVISMTIDRVTTNTVTVQLRTSLQGKTVDSLTYLNASITQQLSITSFRKGCVSYAIQLAPGQPSNIMTMTCEEENVFRYAYSPAGQPRETLFKLKRL